MKVYLDNNPVLYPTDVMLNPTFTIRKQDENGEPAFSFSGDLEFIESDYDYIFLMLKTHPNARTNEIELKFVDDCCDNKEYLFKITHESIRWCDGECKLTCTPIEKSTANDQIICLKNTQIYDDYNGFKSQQHPRITYCNELRPDWIHHVIMLFALNMALNIIILAPLFAVIAVIVNIINAIIGALNNLIPGTDNDLKTIQFDNNPETGPYQELISNFNNLINRVIGCGRKHPSPYVRSYAQNVCGKCGLQFQSSIFSPGSTYYDTVYMSAPIDKGVVVNDLTTYWIDKNKPLLSGTMFFDQLKPIYNAKWRVKNNTLIFERRDQVNNDAPFLDLTGLNDDTYTICWSWQKKKAPSYGNFKYQKDSINWLGAEAMDRWSDIIEWNNPYTPNQVGEFAPFIEFTPARFRDDGIDNDILSAYKWAPYLGGIIQQWDNVLLLNTHQSYQPLLLIHDVNSGLDNAKVKNDYFYPNYPGVALNQFYNYPYWFQEGYSNNLYTNFWYIDDPRTSGYKGFEFVAEVEMNCDILNSFDIDGRIITSEGISKELTEIVLNFKQGKITIKGVV